MMQLLCNGVVLDLNEGSKLSFKKSNPLFAFDDLSCERTTSFDLPKTAKNNKVFSLSNDPAYYGTGMRKRFTAQLQNGVCVKDGYLYVESFNKTYKAIFVTGELIGLQRIKDIGKIPDIVDLKDWATYGGTVIDADTRPSSAWNNIKYMLNDSGTIFPSAKVKYIVDKVVEQNNLAAITLPTSTNEVRLIPGKLNGFTKGDIQFKSTVIDGSQPLADDPDAPYNSLTSNHMELFEVAHGFAYVTMMGLFRSYRVMQFANQQELKISFPDNWSDKLYIVSFDEYGNHSFLGNWSFTKVWDQPTQRAIISHGANEVPLKGRTVTIPKNSIFIFCHEDDYICQRGTSATSIDKGWYFSNAYGMSWDFTLKVVGGEMELQSRVRLQDHLPSITLTDMLKIIAAISGKVLNYTDKDGVTFDDLALSTWSTVDLTGKATEIGEVKRTFSNYGQLNVMTFDRDEWVINDIESVYTIDNENIEAEKTLVKIPFNEGNGSTVLYVDNSEETDKMTICDSNTTYKSLIRCQLPINSGLKTLCDASTSVKAKAHMSQYEYEQIGAKTKILLNGVLYVWTSSVWSNDSVEFTLAKI